MTTPRLPVLDRDALDPARREIVDEVMAGRGRLPTPFRVWIASPELARRMHPLGQFVTSGTSLSKAEVEIAVLAAAAHWQADYVLHTHGAEARESGLDESVIDALTTGQAARPTDARQRAVAEMMATLTSAGNPDQSVFDAAVAAIGHDGVAEVIAITGYFSAVALAMKFYAVTPPGGSQP